MNPAELRLTIEKLVYGGHGLARQEGRVWLTPFVLPGEEIVARPADKLHASLVRIEQPAPERVPAPCPYFGDCGGCQYQHAPYEYQLEQKREILREVLRRVGKLDAPEHIETISGDPWQYRNRTQLHVRSGRIGYLRMGSHDLCPIDHCPISSPRLNEAITALARMAADRRFPNFIRTVELFTNETDVQLNVIQTDRPLARHFFDWCASEIPGYKPGAIEYAAAGEQFRIGPRSFFQVNRHLVDALTSTALGDAHGDSAIDLYAGAGLFTLPLARRFSRVTAVESGSNAVADLDFNATRAGLTVESIRATVDEHLASASRSADFVLADPPRDGLGKRAVRELVRLAPPRLHIVACDPATLARDLRGLLDAGYRVDRMILVELFPQTYHLETVVHLSHA